MRVKTYLVGGAVRDMLSGRPIKDNDYVVFGLSKDELLARFPKAVTVGRDDVAIVIRGDEYTIPRGKTIDEDLELRDFTINAMAIDENGELFAHPRALEDLHFKRLHPAFPDTFTSDPARIFRAARFCAELPDYSLSDEAVDAMRAEARKETLEDLPAERVSNELAKALKSSVPSRFFSTLDKVDALEGWFPELAACKNIPAGPAKFHSKDVFGHLLDVMDTVKGDAWATWGALCHDLGKSLTKQELLPRHIGHDAVADELITTLVKRLKLSRKHLYVGQVCARWHMVAARYTELRPSTKVKVITHATKHQALETLFQVVKGDTGLDFGKQAQADFTIISKVHLPPEKQNLGKKSGEFLLQLQAEALASHYSKQ